LAQRARIVLTCADGLENKAVARLLDVHAMTVGKWRRRFLAQRVEGLRDEPRPGAPRTIEDERIESVIARTLESQPDGATHWSSRGMALRAETAPAGDVQAFHRPRFCRQSARRCRVVSVST
jgi:transposase